MPNIFITSDFHFGHIQPFLWEPRGFSSIEEHDETIIDNFNSVVNPNDIVYCLGDLMLNDTEHGLQCLNRLNGHIIIAKGNHDSIKRIQAYGQIMNNPIEYRCKISDIQVGYQLKVSKWNFYLSHYPMITSNENNDKAPWQRVWSLCGHSHTKDKFLHFTHGAYHCELDCHYNRPVHIEDIIIDIKSKN